MHCGFRPGDRVRIKSKEEQSKGHGFESGMSYFCGRTATLEEILTKGGIWSDGAFTVKLNFDDKSPGCDRWATPPDAWGWSTSMIELIEPLTGIFSTRASNEINW